MVHMWQGRLTSVCGRRGHRTKQIRFAAEQRSDYCGVERLTAVASFNSFTGGRVNYYYCCCYCCCCCCLIHWRTRKSLLLLLLLLCCCFIHRRARKSLLLLLLLLPLTPEQLSVWEKKKLFCNKWLESKHFHFENLCLSRVI
jgi:hypothetical protein